MSTLDATLTALAGLITQNIYPALCRRLSLVPWDGRARLMLGRAVNLGCAITVITCALVMARKGTSGVFELLINIFALVSVPLAVPMMWGLFVRRVPNCAAPISVIVGVTVSSSIAYGPKLLGTAPWLYQEQIIALLVAGTLAFFGARFFYRRENPEVVAREQEFFTNRDRSVDFAAEVGAGNDSRQMRIIGIFALFMGAAILLLLIPSSSIGHWGKIASIAGTIGAIGALLIYCSRINQTNRSELKK